jgi:biopolymer transport protein ExbD
MISSRHRQRTQLMSDINITPFTDVVLVLLVIFMVTTPIILQQGIKIKLPKASSAETESDRSIVITINSSGLIFIDKMPYALETLKEELSARIANRADSPVIIKGDKEVKYDIVIQVLDIAKASGAKKFALAVDLKK